MSLYVKGKVEPPICCFDCSTKVDPDNRRCNLDGHVFDETLGKLTSRRDVDCPVSIVPYHGRLVDADMLKERATKRLYASNHGSMAEAYFSALIDLIDEAPTIISADTGG